MRKATTKKKRIPIPGFEGFRLTPDEAARAVRGWTTILEDADHAAELALVAFSIAFAADAEREDYAIAIEHVVIGRSFAASEAVRAEMMKRLQAIQKGGAG